MDKKTVYLAGPIRGLREGDAKDWRSRAAKRFYAAGIRSLDPLRCEPSIDPGTKYEPTYTTPWGPASHIHLKNQFDVLNSDVILAYFPFYDDEIVDKEYLRTYFADLAPDDTITQAQLKKALADAPDPVAMHKMVSVGTLLEVGWSSKEKKAVFIVCDSDYMAKHPLLQETGVVLQDLDLAITMIIELLSPFHEGGDPDRI